MHPDPVQYRLGANCNGSTKREVAKVFFGCRVGRKSNFWEKGGEESKSFTKGLVESKAPFMVSWFTSKINSITSKNGANRKATTRRARGEVAKSKEIAVQGLLYVGAFYITWMFPTISRITELVFKKNYFPIQFLDTFLIPLQGFSIS